MNEHKTETLLLPCPLCGAHPIVKDWGIECRGCGLWLAIGDRTYKLGGTVRVWNSRAGTHITETEDDL